jgi:pSer/pThr/pTyr-binding forkhead associated (FHA) protein
VFCTSCGESLPSDANFCPECGHEVERSDGAGAEAPTGAIDLGGLEGDADLEDLPELPAGTGLLVVVRGPNAGSRYLLDRESTTVGRHPDSHVFLDDVTVSRHHARVDREDDEFVLHDLGSLNGTYLSGERVDRRHLRSGDELQVGRYKLLFVGAPS